ncbi:hypothetical protein [Natrialba asiatica]|uniref:Uncharacterized protein n=1 Tax=Natrialba asiatica (strain ATCC 700177 / DSM 12278 / JCM 9576 / FERM P-10747 / NBRC 102637 / 172P1) TaxID=29540 RepID=M0AKK1_NATA1|nr:hypothetical protein [Natrialba asiatica]ELY97913.1 hypothetical protein C481_18295 [Natrialba asiatica DSM 12278]
MQFSKAHTVAVVAVLALVTITVAGFSGAAAAQNSDLDEVENRTVETSNETEYVEADIVFSDTFENTSSETAELTIYEESAYNQSGTSATPVLEDSWTASPGDNVTSEFNLSDTSVDLSQESEYRAILTVSNENNVDSAYVAADDESIGGGWFGGGLDGSPGFGAVAAIVAIGVALVARLRAGGA